MMHLAFRARKRASRVALGRGEAGRAPRGRAALMVAFALLAGCPARFDPRADTLGGAGDVRAADPVADAAWREARAKYDRGEMAAARDGFEALRMRGDALGPAATLWEVRSDLALGQATVARTLVEPLAGPANDAISSQARFLLGLTLARLGEGQRAQALLLPFVGLVQSGEDAADLHASLASAAAALGDVPAALLSLEKFYPEARPSERAWVRDRATALAAGMSDVNARALFNLSASGSLARAVLGGRLATLVADPAGARSIADEARAARTRFGFVAQERGASASVRAIGVALPLSGKSHLVGERALRGALLAAGVLGGEGPAIEVRVRDTGSRPELAAAAVDELAKEGVLAVVLSPDRAEATVAAARAGLLGLAAFDLSPDESVAGVAHFHLIRSNLARASALAEQASRSGARRVATLFPDNAYGHKMSDAFAAAAQAAGAVVVAQIHFEEKATTFIAPAKQLAGLAPDAVFVPAAAGQLELIAAQLASLAVTGGGGHHGATIYATADGAGAKLIANAGRYLQGAVLAPVFFGGGSESAGAILDRYRAAFAEEPGAADALAFDAVTAARAAIARLPMGDLAGEGQRLLAGLIASGHADGLTGPVAFAASGQRAGAPSLFTIDGDKVKALP